MSLRSLRKAPLLLVAILGLSVMAVVSRVGAAEDTIELLPHWKKGEKLRYEVVKSRQKIQGDKVTAKTSARTDLEIEVLDAGRDGFVLAWTWGETRFDDPAQARNPVLSKLANLAKGTRIVLELDSRARIQGVRNWKELKASSTKFLDTLVDELKAAGIDPATVAKLRTQVASTFATKEQIEQFGTREAQLLFMALGRELKGDKPVEFEDKLPNPFGGESFPSHARFALKGVDRKRGVATVSWTQALVPEDARRIMEKTLKEMGSRLGKPAPGGDIFKSLTIEDTAEFTIELSSGWVQAFTHKRKTKMDGTSGEDAITVTRVKNQK
jgi:hypothetical protein